MSSSMPPPEVPPQPPAPPTPQPRGSYAAASSGHPVQLSVPLAASYSRGLAILGVPFLYGRVIALIPVFIVLFVLGIAAFFTALVMQFVVLFTGSYPEGAHSFLVGFLRLSVKASSWEFGLTDRYPGFSLQADQPSHTSSPPVELSVVHQEGYSRGLAILGCIVFIGRVIALIPVFVVLYFLRIAAFLVAWVLQFYVLFAGRYSEGAHTFVTGFLRLGMRTDAWALGLTDKYPGFSLQP
jgi:Domain of unknown function (DUF4389)